MKQCTDFRFWQKRAIPKVIELLLESVPQALAQVVIMLQGDPGDITALQIATLASSFVSASLFGAMLDQALDLTPHRHRVELTNDRLAVRVQSLSTSVSRRRLML